MKKDSDPDNNFNPAQNYEKSRKDIGYIPRYRATQADYDRIGFMSGVEVHQQLKTQKKLFCNCPAGLYNRKDKYDAEIIRHMRPTLSELGEYDGTALMEFKTRKQIIYRIKNETACTYDIDDTPPFPMNREALDIALEISLLCKLNIVGEVHITRKQYLDGSIPTGFQRTAILGVEGEIKLRNKKVRLIQLSIEEDSCREISDIGHLRIYQTDRLGMPLIETVTYPDFTNPDEVREGTEYIRFLNRSTGKVMTGIGSGREDVNVSCRGGNRVEIKGVAHNKWIPELTHNEAFRQWALLHIKDLLKQRVDNPKKWRIGSKDLRAEDFAIDPDYFVCAVNLPGFKSILTHFTQPGKIFADELSDRLKVIACIEKPNMTHSEEFEPVVSNDIWTKIRAQLKSDEQDAQLVIWGPQDDKSTALETVEERCRLAFEQVPRESRKSFANGTTIFERVLPGPDRMYPDTDSPPIALDDEYIQAISKSLPVSVFDRFKQLRKWRIPEDTYPYILRNNLMPLLERIVSELDLQPRFGGTLLGHTLKHIEGRYPTSPEFTFDIVFTLLKFLIQKKIDPVLARVMLDELYQHPRMDFDSVLANISFKKIPPEEILGKVPFLWQIAEKSGISSLPEARIRWMMGELHNPALGNIPLADLKDFVAEHNAGKYGSDNE